MNQTVVFITDFGLEDGYAAELRASVWRVERTASCVDGSHLVPPGDVLTAAYLSKRLARAFGPGSVICTVVDPGVGGDRQAVAVECDGVFGVAPDTGLLSYMWLEARERSAVRLPSPASRSATFHGRDVFAPLAAHLAAGRPIREVGEPIDAPRLRSELFPVAEGGRIRSLVVSVDHFGNCVTGIRRADLGGRRVAKLRSPEVQATRTVATYSDIGSGLAVLWNSADHLELAAQEDSAARRAGLRVGSPVEVELR